MTRLSGSPRLVGIFRPLCDGFVRPATRVALQGPRPIIKCNRKPKKEYKYFFRETSCGSENSTRACIERLGKKRVEEGLDILKGEHHDMLDKRVYDREKVRIKDRECFLEHFSPPFAVRARRRRGTRGGGKMSPTVGSKMRT